MGSFYYKVGIINITCYHFLFHWYGKLDLWILLVLKSSWITTIKPSPTMKNNWGVNGQPCHTHWSNANPMDNFPLITILTLTSRNKIFFMLLNSLGIPRQCILSNKNSQFILSYGFKKFNLRKKLGHLDLLAHEIVSWDSKMLKIYLKAKKLNGCG